jgi:hypothetical protein
MSYPARQPALNQTVVFSWPVMFLSVVLKPSVWVFLSWWNVVLLVYSEQSRSLEQVIRLSLHNRLLWVAFCQFSSCCFLQEVGD